MIDDELSVYVAFSVRSRQLDNCCEVEKILFYIRLDLSLPVL